MCDSQAAILALQDEADSKCKKIRRCWGHINQLASQGHRIHFQWVPGHAGLGPNEEADNLARRGAQERQENIAIDLDSARMATAMKLNEFQKARAQDTHTHPAPTPETEQLPRRPQIIISQIRVGSTTITRDTAHRFGQAPDDRCPDCGDEDSIEHLLTQCPAYQGPRQRRWGPTPTQQEIMTDAATKLWSFLLEVGRVPREPP